jgi:hypothetical protein
LNLDAAEVEFPLLPKVALQHLTQSCAMSTASGLTRRRGGGGGGPSAGGDDENDDLTRGGSPAPKAGGSRDTSAPETSYESGENGHKIAFDPRDISESAERSKQPKLTLMEEVLLLGLKDKQVSRPLMIATWRLVRGFNCLITARDIFHSGTTIFHMRYGAAL